MPGSKKLAIALGVLVVVIYMRYYMLPSSKSELLQMPLASLDAKCLFEKLPIVIDDGIVDPLDFIHKVFKYLYVYKTITNGLTDIDYKGSNAIRSSARFTLLISSHDENIVVLKHPTQGTGISVQLRKHKCIIVPYKWQYSCSRNISTQRYELHDLLTAIASRFQRKTLSPT